MNGSELILQIVIVKSLNFAGLLREFRADPLSLFPFPSFFVYNTFFPPFLVPRYIFSLVFFRSLSLSLLPLLFVRKAL